MKKIAGLLVLVGALGCSEATDPGSRVPTAPTNLSITKTSAGLHISWLDRSNTEDLYRVEVSVNNGAWSQLIETVANVVSADLANPLPGTRYAFRVSACNQVGCSAPLEGSIVTASNSTTGTLAIRTFRLTDM